MFILCDRLRRAFTSSLALNFCKWLIKLKFPQIRQITTQELTEWLLNPQKTQPLIIHARGQAEYEVSHMKQAVHIQPTTPDLTKLSTIARDTPIVVYCSIGYRSAKISQMLEQQGFECVYNLIGGLFQWVNEGQPIFHNEQPTQFIHPYNAIWGKLLNNRCQKCLAFPL